MKNSKMDLSEVGVFFEKLQKETRAGNPQTVTVALKDGRELGGEVGSPTRNAIYIDGERIAAVAVENISLSPFQKECAVA